MLKVGVREAPTSNGARAGLRLAESRCRGDRMHLAHKGVASEEEDPRRVLVVGRRTLYLQALCEFLECTSGLSVTLISPAQLNDSLQGPRPDVVLVDGSTSLDAMDSLEAIVGKFHADTRIVLLTSGSARESSRRAATLHAAGWASMTLPVEDLVAVIADREKKTRSDRRHPPRRRSPRSISEGDKRLSSVTERELSVLQLVVEGRSADEIAATLHITRNTVRTHLQNVMAKLLVSSKTEMVSVARSLGVRPRSVEPSS